MILYATVQRAAGTRTRIFSLQSDCLEAVEAGRGGDFKILLVGFAQLLYLILDVGVCRS